MTLLLQKRAWVSIILVIEKLPEWFCEMKRKREFVQLTAEDRTFMEKLYEEQKNDVLYRDP